MDLFAGRQLESQVVDVQVNLEITTAAELLRGVLEALHQACVVNLQAKGGEQFAQLAVGVVQAFAQLGGDAFQGLYRLAAAHQGLHAADLQFHVGQRLGQ
ncbi:hypothetical protein D3C72_1898860 [compost metagenome]